MNNDNYSVRLFQFDGDWIAEYPDLPGCSGIGDTKEEALESAEISKNRWLEDYFEENNTYPKPKELFEKTYSGTFNLRIAPDLHRELAIKADEQKISLNQYCAYLLAYGLGEK